MCGEESPNTDEQLCFLTGRSRPDSCRDGVASATENKLPIESRWVKVKRWARLQSGIIRLSADKVRAHRPGGDIGGRVNLTRCKFMQAVYTARYYAAGWNA